jgi:hypothetical protein
MLNQTRLVRVGQKGGIERYVHVARIYGPYEQVIEADALPGSNIIFFSIEVKRHDT